jgi:ABC-type spermidine/putrescine transport system permease subunit I
VADASEGPARRRRTREGTDPRWLWQAFAAPGLLWLVALFVVPFYAILAVAMGTIDPLFGLAQPVWNPVQWDPTTFLQVLRDLAGGRLTPIFLRTISYVVVASVLCIAIGYPVAYFIARRAGRWKVTLLVLLILPFWINYIMRMLAWVNLLSVDGLANQAMVALGLLSAPQDWLAGRSSTVVLGLVYGYIPYFILPLYAALDRIGEDLLEASRDLGASPFWTFARITLPLSRQGILAGTVLIMLPMFGDYYTPNLLSGSPRTRMIGNEIDQFISSGIGGTEGAALTVVLMAFVGLLMSYYLISVARETRRAAR